jgi:Flp pilus assembly protein TadD
LVIAVAGVIAYSNSVDAPFVFDDNRSIIENVTVRQLSWSTLLHPQNQTPMAGRPLPNLSLALNWAVSGQAPESYRLFNIAVHIIAALLLFAVLRHIPPWPSADERTTNRVALFCTLIWLVHPLNTEAVDYITQRTESMAGAFYLLTLYAAIRASRDAPGWRWPVIAGIAAWCGTASKEAMVTAPFLLLLWDRTFVSPSFKAAIQRHARVYVAVASSWLLFIALVRNTPFFSEAGFETSVSRWTYLLNQAPMIVRYLRLSIWPVGLVLDYGVPKHLTLVDVWPSALFLTMLLAASLMLVVRAPRIGFWAAWFFVTLAPASSFLPIPSEVGAERRMYLPLIALIVLYVSATRWLLERTPARRARQIELAAGLATLVVLTSLTILRNGEYRSAVGIWETVIARYPHARAHENLAVELRDAGRDEEAIAHLRVAAPELPDAKHVLASALLNQGHLAEGIDELQAFVDANPHDREIVSARVELAAALVQRGDRDGAISQYRAIIDAMPQYGEARANLIGLLLQQQRFGVAEAEGRAYVTARPNDAEAHNLLGVALASQGKLGEAVPQFETAIKLDPKAERPRLNLARALAVPQAATGR